LTEEPSPELFDATAVNPGAVPVSVDVSMNWGELKDGAEIMRLRPHPPDAHVNMNAVIPTYIAFREGDRQIDADWLKVLFKWIDAYVRGFEPVFRGELRMGKGSPIKSAPAS
jgi:hypothetical protein